MANPSPPLILNVDDNAGARYARHRLLRNAGFDVLDAATGSEALGLLSRCPQLVILDVGLPDIDGFEVCRRIKASPQTASIVVLQVSASFVKGTDRTRALEGGADSFVTEPVEPEVLVATVNALLRMRRAEEAVKVAAQEWAATFEAINEGVALLDAEGRIQRGNQAFHRFLLRPPDEIVGRTWRELFETTAQEQWRVEAAPAASLEPRSTFRVGERWVQVSTMPVDGGAPGRTVVVLTDVTDHTTALQAAEDTNRLKDEFLAVLSHELRTPLNAIVGWAKLLQMGQLGQAETQKALQTISRNANAQNQLISDILDVSCIIAGKLRLDIEPMDLRLAVQSAVDAVQPTALGKGVRIATQLGADEQAMDGDPRRLEQVVGNLVSNAIKFAPRDGLVSVCVHPPDEESLAIVVEDDGPGIKPEFLPYVFDRFRQADSSSSRPKGGLGLGLAIVKHLVDLHGGQVAVRNRTGRSGACFTVTLPRLHHASTPNQTRAVETAGSAAPASDPTAPLRGVRVLVVDDQQDARDLVSTVLAQAGADVVTAASSFEALPILERERPNLLLCDIAMAGDDGYSLMRKIRALPAARGGAIPAVALTGHARQEDAMAALAAGFQVHLTKPIQAADLVGIVTRLAGQR